MDRVQHGLDRDSSHQIYDDLQASPWMTLPVRSDLAEQTMFDLVSIAGAGGIVPNGDPRVQSIGQLWRHPLSQVLSSAMAATAIAVVPWALG